jgi:hypothetical protein
MSGVGRVLVVAALLLGSGACGFRFALGANRYGGPLIPVEVVDRGGGQVGEAVRGYLPGALAAAGLRAGEGPARRLLVEVQPWVEAPLYSTISGAPVAYAERFTVTAVARVDGHPSPIRATVTVTLRPSSDLDRRPDNLARATELLGERLAAELVRRLE